VDGIGMGPDGPVGLVTKPHLKKVVFCVPTRAHPHPAFIDSLSETVPLLDQEGWEHGLGFEAGSPYISGSRATLLRRALDAKADTVVFLDDDLSWNPPDLVKLISTKGEVISGTYRFKQQNEEYMGLLLDGTDNRPIVRDDGCVAAELIPAGFLKITTGAVDKFMRGYPELQYGSAYSPHIDLFNHGAHEGRWWGEDYAFSRRWRKIGGELWIVPNLNIDHHQDKQVWKGNFHEFLLRQPGGSHHTRIEYNLEVSYGTADRVRPVKRKKAVTNGKSRVGASRNTGLQSVKRPRRGSRSQRPSSAV
jgi:hypothetical protein